MKTMNVVLGSRRRALFRRGALFGEDLVVIEEHGDGIILRNIF
jgi:predicted RNA-binding protein